MSTRSKIWENLFQCKEKDCLRRSIKGDYCEYHYAEKVIKQAKEEGWLDALLEKILGGLEVEIAYNEAKKNE